MKRIKSLVLIIFCSFLTSCHSSKIDPTQQIVTVYPNSNIRHLYYNGTIKPIQEQLIISPAAGIISKMNFHYGDAVNRGDVLFTIHSPEMEREFRESIANYLRAKHAYLASKKSMGGTEMLYKEKIISEQEYESEKGQFQSNTLSFVEANTKIKQFLAYLPSFQENFLKPDAINLDEAVKILQANLDDLVITASSSGIILFPTEKSSDEHPFEVGMEVKKNDVLIAIGNLNGLSVTTNVTENDINSIKLGASVILSLQSELEMDLRGAIVSVARQARPGESTGFSTFPVVIQVPRLSKSAMQKIRVGMNVKLDILLEDPPSIKIPIIAIHQKDQKFYVDTLDANEHLVSKEVVPGSTSQHEVTILKGLNKGDRVVIHD